MPPTKTTAFADLWELVYDELAADEETDRDAVVIFGRDDGGTGRRTYAQLEENANRFANHLLSLGVEPGDTVAIYTENRIEYVEAMIGTYKVRATPITVNFRYVESELQYLLEDCGAKVVLHEPHFSTNLAAVRDQLPAVEHTIEMGSQFDDVLAASSAERPEIQRSGDDHYLIYTGGTTGMPKGVVWRQDDAFYQCLGGGDPMRLLGEIERPEEITDRIVSGITAMLLAPFMHAAGFWVTWMWLLSGGKAVLPRGSLDPELVWDTVDAEGATMMTVVGDAVGRPLFDTWDSQPDRWDASTLMAISNGGAPMSVALRSRIVETFPDVILTDGFGSSEAGTQGTNRASAGDGPVEAPRFTIDETTVVLDDENQPIEAGSEKTGRVARAGRLPIGYLNDPEKTARTFVTIDGTRWLITGDMARVRDDGTIELLGRDAATINTGGEKVHGEEVENVLRSHPAVYDVTVVGVPDERWGSAVCAVVQPTEGASPTLDDLADHCRGQLAGYKLPRRLVLVDRVVRSPAGKADLRWAKETAEQAVAREVGTGEGVG